MDPLSISASLVALITLTGTVTASLIDIRNALKDAPDDILTVLTEIEEFQAVLSYTRDLSNESSLDASAVLSSLSSRVKHKLLELEKILHYKILQGAPVTGEKSGVPKLRWIRARGKIEAIRKDLYDIRLGLVTALLSVTARSAVTTDTRLRRIEFSLKELGSRQQTTMEPTMIEQAITKIIRSKVLFLASSANSALGPDAHKNDQEDKEEDDAVQVLTHSVQPSQPPTLCEMADGRVALHTNRPTPPEWQCDPWCACVCHRRQRWRTPTSFQSLLGSLSLDYPGVFLSKPPCTERRCRSPSAQSTKAAYRFPTWLAACRITVSLGRPSACLRAVRVVPNDAPIFIYAETGDVEGLKMLFKSGLASPWDVNDKGDTALWVSPTFSPHTLDDVCQTIDILRQRSFNPTSGNIDATCRFLIQAGVDPAAESALGLYVQSSLYNLNDVKIYLTLIALQLTTR